MVEKKIENCKQEVQAAHIFIQKQQIWWHLHFLFANFNFCSQLCLGAFKIQAHCLIYKYA
jgi:hypothetical protein